MHVFIVYAHPSEDSFTRHARDSFMQGLKDAGHTCTLSDLYHMDFKTDMSEEEYLREAGYHSDLPVAEDVRGEQQKINSSDAIVFIYPVFWTEAPAKLVGWFDRVWTYGFAYGTRSMKKLQKALVICIAGHTTKHLEEYGHLQSMRTVMLGDRIFDRADYKDFIVLDGTAKHDMDLRNANWHKHLRTAYEAGKTI